MKTFVTVALLLALSASAVMAIPATITEMRTGVIAENEMVDVMGASVVVTSVRYNGFSCTEIVAGPYTAIWVYTGSAPTVIVGDVIDILGGEYKEYYDLSEIDMTTFAGTVMVMGTMPAPYLPMTLADVQLDDEAWESHVLSITDGFTVLTAPSGYGEWDAISAENAATLAHDDYYFDESLLLVGDCYLGVTGLYTYSYGAYKINPLVDGLTVVDCSVGNDDVSFGSLKGMYR
jgi:hypothetical protein